MSDGIDKILKEPIWDEFDENAFRIRNLLFFATITLLILKFDLVLKPETSFLGIQFQNFNDNILRYALWCAVLYHYIHFLIICKSYYDRWKIRLTGYVATYITQSPQQDFPITNNHSTLYAFLLNIRPSVLSMEREIKAKIEQIPNFIKDPGCMEQIVLRSELNTLIQNLDVLGKSLERFDKAFKNFQQIQIVRWFILEMLLPVLLGTIALGWSSINVWF
jgi:hypothetical protein